MHPLDLTPEQRAVITASANNVPPSWREQFLASVADDLFGVGLGRTITDDDVARAVSGVAWAMTVGTVDDDD